MDKLKNGVFHGVMGILLGFALIFGIKFVLDEVKLSNFESSHGVCVNKGSVDEPKYYLEYSVGSDSYSIDLSKKFLIKSEEGVEIELFYNSSNPSQIIFASTPVEDIILLVGCMIIFIILKIIE